MTSYSLLNNNTSPNPNVITQGELILWWLRDPTQRSAHGTLGEGV